MMGKSSVPEIGRAAALAAALALGPIAAPAAFPALAQVAEAEASPPARKARLDALFASLSTAASEAEADAIVAEIWSTWTRSGRQDVDLLMEQAGLGMASRNFGLASLLLDEVVELAPDFAEGWNRRATLRFMMGDMAGSEADIARVLALEPRHFGALSGRAMIHMRAERWQEAAAAYRAALQANPFLPERHRVLPELERRARDGRL